MEAVSFWSFRNFYPGDRVIADSSLPSALLNKVQCSCLMFDYF